MQVYCSTNVLLFLISASSAESMLYFTCTGQCAAQLQIICITSYLVTIQSKKSGSWTALFQVATSAFWTTFPHSRMSSVYLPFNSILGSVNLLNPLFVPPLLQFYAIIHSWLHLFHVFQMHLYLQSHQKICILFNNSVLSRRLRHVLSITFECASGHTSKRTWSTAPADSVWGRKRQFKSCLPLRLAVPVENQLLSFNLLVLNYNNTIT